MNYEREYTPPILTVDGVVFQLQNNQLSVLLIRRAYEPFKGEWALPGGYNSAGETTREALDRVMQQKTGITLANLGLVEQLYAFDTVARDPRGHAVSITFMGLGRDISPPLTPETQEPQFFPLARLPQLAYDHDKIIRFAHDRLKRMAIDTNAPAALLPPTFTLSQAQSAYEAVLGQKLDKRNFRKRILATNFLDELDEFSAPGAHRPARLYKFHDTQLHSIVQNFM